MVYMVKSKSDLDQKLEEAADRLVIIDFFATWCGPCKMIAPELDVLAKEHGDKLVILKVDVDECEDIAMEYNISSMPTFIFIKNKAQVNEFVGASKEKLAQITAKLL